MRARGTWVAVALVAGLLGACRKSEAPSPQPSAEPAADAPATDAAPADGAAPEAAPPAPPAPPQGSLRVEVGLGGSADDGVRDALPSFPPGSGLTAGVDAGGLPPGAIVKATWVDPSGRRLGEEHQSVESGVRWLLFKARESPEWSEGTYRVDFLVSTGGSGSRTFQIAPGARPQATPIPG